VLKSLANSSCLSNLNELNLLKCKSVSDTGLTLIFNSEYCMNLEKIELGETLIGVLFSSKK